ncbi:SAV_2336 N-terminal domain-related protein [Methylomonas sp. MV1]|uniref:SAV_2336 N-terminal domain-related protein n=1 Tax=Methylomonas sp. MV1 TaxID=3073620 RepID=UPI0028A4E1FF|nr:SAV_2336 N-terminal domain-related protein [Methylomonas sp. MV1]MDT4328924.1 SAV_2336 N-terminal domain-related protein [Methylomonas sp. MV1]
MSEYLHKLLNEFNRAGLNPMPLEFAEVLWLATHTSTNITPSISSLSGLEKPTTSGPTPASNQNELPDNSLPQAPLKEQHREDSSRNQADLYPRSPIEEGQHPARPFRSPAVPNLSNTLSLGRALRPLSRKITSRTRRHLNEEATAERFAEGSIIGQALWIPVLEPVSERWFELALVVDQSDSMQVWQPVIADLRRLLSYHGAFRTVRLWHLETNTSQALLRIGAHISNARICKGKELGVTTKQQLILVISDCISKAWHTGSVGNLLETLCEISPLAVLQMLPQRMWRGTALGRGIETRLCAAEPGAVASGLPEVDSFKQYPNDVEEPYQYKTWRLPVLTLESDVLLAWANLLSGRRNVWINAIRFDRQTRYSLDDSVLTALPTAGAIAKRLHRFVAEASPRAQELAGYLAAVPLTLPVMRLVQQIMVPQSGHTELAEIFVSGLLRKYDVSGKSHKDTFYDFHEGVRDHLLDTVGNSEVVEVLRLTSDFVSSHSGQALDFHALITDPTADSDFSVDGNTRYFAKVGAKVLRRLGGDYLRLAETLERRVLVESKNQSKLESPLEIIEGGPVTQRHVSKNFRWIHLSDFHFDGEEPYERNTVLKSLLDEIRDRRRYEGFQTDALFVTGDIANSGQSNEYKAASAFFDALLETSGLDKSRLFIVPGNHDVDTYAAKGLDRGLLSEADSIAYFANGKPKYHFNKFAPFRKWYNGYFKNIRSCPKDDTCHSLQQFEVNGNTIAVLAINTALFSVPDGKDYNALWIGRRNLDAAIAELEKAKTDVSFVLMHHPLDWLHDDERTQIKSALQQRADFILRGHLHHNEVDSIVNSQGACFHIAAGACYQTRKYPNSALFCSVDVEKEQLEILPFHYEDSPKAKWVPDISLFEPPDYIGRFPLSGLRFNKQQASKESVFPGAVGIQLESAVDSNTNWKRDFSFFNDNSKRFRVAFSFSGEKRQFVEQTARILAERFGEEQILYDKFHEAEFARYDLGIYLPKLYREQSELIVPVLCENYDQKRWTGWEWMHIYGLLIEDDGYRVMPSRFNHAHADGLSSVAGFIELDDKSPEHFANLILQRLAIIEGNPMDHYSQSNAGHTKQASKVVNPLDRDHINYARTRLKAAPQFFEALQQDFGNEYPDLSVPATETNMVDYFASSAAEQVQELFYMVRRALKKVKAKLLDQSAIKQTCEAASATYFLAAIRLVDRAAHEAGNTVLQVPRSDNVICAIIATALFGGRLRLQSSNQPNLPVADYVFEVTVPASGDLMQVGLERALYSVLFADTKESAVKALDNAPLSDHERAVLATRLRDIKHVKRESLALIVRGHVSQEAVRPFSQQYQIPVMFPSSQVTDLLIGMSADSLISEIKEFWKSINGMVSEKVVPVTPKVFISYSHDSPEHKAEVLALANRLRKEGIDCEIDQYINGAPKEGWIRWLDWQIERADFVLVVCTEIYLQRCKGDDRLGGRGVKFEGLLISQTLYDQFLGNAKFLPLILENGSIDHVPLFLKGSTTYKIYSDYEKLYRVLTFQPIVEMPPSGQRVILNPANVNALNHQISVEKPQVRVAAQSNNDDKPQIRQKLINSLAKELRREELQTLVTDFVERINANFNTTFPNNQTNDKAFASYLVNQDDDELRRLQILYLLDAMEDKSNIQEAQDLLAYLLLTLVRKDEINTDSINRVPFNFPPTLDLLIASRHNQALIPDYSYTEFNNGRQKPDIYELDDYQSPSGQWDKERVCQEIAKELLRKLGVPVADNDNALSLLLSLIRSYDTQPQLCPIKGIRIHQSCFDKHPLATPEIAEYFLNKIGRYLPVFVYGNDKEGDEQDYLYIGEDDIRGMLLTRLQPKMPHNSN